MRGQKVFIGPKLREMRQARKITQAGLASALNVSASYINLIERNQRSASVKFLINLSDTYGIDWRQLTDADSSLKLSDLREISRDPAFGQTSPDIEELRATLESAPNVARGIFNMYRIYRQYGERLAEQSEALAFHNEDGKAIEEVVLQMFRLNNNYFDQVEQAADHLRAKNAGTDDELYSFLKSYLINVLGVLPAVVPSEEIGSGVRYFDRTSSKVLLSEGLDHTNRIFQLAHTIALIQHSDVLSEAIAVAKIHDEHAVSRCRIELANYFAAAVMMPYDSFYETALESKYDIDHLATRFGVSYEHACHRLTTLQKPGAKAIPFFFLRVDRAGNVTKRFNATEIQMARFGGTCPRLDVHYCFRIAGRTITQVIEMPDHSRYLTINRTVDRPSLRFSKQDNRLALSIGCSMTHASEMIYGENLSLSANEAVTEVGVNCRLCPRRQCAQRANPPFFENLQLDENRRGATRFES